MQRQDRNRRLLIRGGAVALLALCTGDVAPLAHAAARRADDVLPSVGEGGLHAVLEQEYGTRPTAPPSRPVGPMPASTPPATQPGTGPDGSPPVAPRNHGAGPGPSIVSVDGRRLMAQKRFADGSLGPATPYTIKGANSCWWRR